MSSSLMKCGLWCNYVLLKDAGWSQVWVWCRPAGTVLLALAAIAEKVMPGTSAKAVLGLGVRLGTRNAEGASRDGRPRGRILDVDGAALCGLELKSSVCL